MHIYIVSKGTKGKIYKMYLDLKLSIREFPVTTWHHFQNERGWGEDRREAHFAG